MKRVRVFRVTDLSGRNGTRQKGGTPSQRRRPDSSTGVDEWIWFLGFVVVVQTALSFIMLITEVDIEIVRSLDRYLVDEPYSAQALWGSYVQIGEWVSYQTIGDLVPLVSCVVGVMVLLLLAIPSHYSFALALGVIYVIPTIALVVGAVLFTVIFIGAVVVGIILGLGVLIASFWLLGQVSQG